jgi:hypothetical protein
MYVFGLIMYIFGLIMYVYSLKMYIFRLIMYIFSIITNVLLSFAKKIAITKLPIITRYFSIHSKKIKNIDIGHVSYLAKIQNMKLDVFFRAFVSGVPSTLGFARIPSQTYDGLLISVPRVNALTP